MDIQSIAGSAAAVFLIPGGFWALGKLGPGLAAGKIHDGFEQVKQSSWVRNPAHPKRARWLKATLELLEEELPNPGMGIEFYAKIGSAISAHVKIGSAEQWGTVMQKLGDGLDTELAKDVAEIADVPIPPAA